MADGIGNGGDCCQESGVLDRLATITKKEFGSQTNERTKGIFQSGICRECVGDTTGYRQSWSGSRLKRLSFNPPLMCKNQR